MAEISVERVSQRSEAIQRRVVGYTSRTDPRRQGISNTVLVPPRSFRKDSTTRGESSTKTFNGRVIRRYVAHARSTGSKSNKIDTSYSVAFLLISSILANSSPEISAAEV